jgi:hypothetical protein
MRKMIDPKVEIIEQVFGNQVGNLFILKARNKPGNQSIYQRLNLSTSQPINR